jgi:hypothetical protein
MNQPRLPRQIPEQYDPYRRLLAAVVLRAIRDVKHAIHGGSARLFLSECSDLSSQFAGIPEPKIKQLLGDTP